VAETSVAVVQYTYTQGRNMEEGNELEENNVYRNGELRKK
jgi:hypothetical protein